MFNKTLFLLSIIVFAFLYKVSAQKVAVSGTVRDTIEKKNIPNAVIMLLTEKDSLIYGFTRSGKDGSFTIQQVTPGNYILMTTHPYFADFVDNITVKNIPASNLGFLPLTSKSKLLQEVIVRSGSPIRIKGDTTIYTADSFKVSANANVEELLKKLPGIQVDKNGEIRAMGERVEKVLVDGEEFFGDDPGMAVKNLRADAVKEVQVFDKKSEQAEFTGIDDGKTQKTINLKLKEDKKKGYFGKIDLAGGLTNNPGNRFNNNLMYSAFKGKRKIGAFLLNGNTGQDGLNWQDEQKYGGENENMTMGLDDEGGFVFMTRGGGTDEEPFVNTQNGFIKNTNAGLTYSNKWNDKTTFNFSPKFNSQVYNNNLSQFTRTAVTPDSVFDANTTRNTYVNRYNLKNSAIYDVKIDSNNSLKLTLRGNYYHTESREEDYSFTTGAQSVLKNTTQRKFNGLSQKQAYSANIIFKHKFKKLRRTLTFTTDWRFLDTDIDNLLQSKNVGFKDGVSDLVIDLDRNNLNARVSNTLSGKVVYTEPLSKKYSLELGYELNLNKGKNDFSVFNKNAVTDKYDVLVDSLSNNFKQTITINRPSAKISFSDKKVKFNMGAGFGLTNFNLADITADTSYKRNFINFFPTAGLTYNYKSNHSLRITYTGNTSQPTINQLQPLRNNNDIFNQYNGNPNLKPTFTHNLNLSHNGYDFLKDRWMYQSLNINVSTNAITNNRTIDLSNGKTITSPVNTNGNMNLSVWTGMGSKFKKMEVRYSIGPTLSYNQFADFINSTKIVTKTLSAGMSVSAQKAKDKKYDFSFYNDFRFNNNRTTQTSNFSTNTFGFNGTVYYKKTWSLISDYMYNWREKIQENSPRISNHMLNARLQKTFRNNEFTLYFVVRDILNQNIGVDMSFYGNTYNETRNDRLRRYWMLGFAWDFKNKAKKTTSTPSK
ncbi:MAG TPA: outer membrane beta-barrel family protein [Chitinophagaceae bacterium]|nr:outer membrane beta-barrel family protein [Chitinophagaceae bacterium]